MGWRVCFNSYIEYDRISYQIIDLFIEIITNWQINILIKIQKTNKCGKIQKEVVKYV